MRALPLAALLPLMLAAGAATGQTCSQLRSCAEALESLRKGNTALDRDGDGVPCQNTLCKDYRRPSQQHRPSPGTGAAAPVIVPGPAPSPRLAAPRSPATAAAAGPVELVSVGDGDTIRVRDAAGQLVTVRLACIDAPETAQGPPGAEATAALRQLLAVGPLELRPQTVDRYGRTVAEVFAAGRNVNLEMVRTGSAFVFYRYLRDCNGAAYEQAEQQAQRFRQGVWRWDQGVERPWDFRSRRSNPQT
jgi:micrococcal nuclease